MLWIKNAVQTYQIMSYNLHEHAGILSLWVTRPDGKSSIIKSGSDAQEYKDAFDHAIRTGESVVEM